MSFPTIISETGGTFTTLFNAASPKAVPIAAGNNGDLLIVGAYGANSITAFTFPAGWIQLGSLANFNGSGYGPLDVRYKIADGSEGSSINITSSTGPESFAYLSTRMRGASGRLAIAMNVGTLFDLHQALTSGFGVIDTTWLAWVGYRDASLRTVTAFPTGYTGTAQYRPSATDAGVACARRDLRAASEDPTQFSWDNACNQVIATIAVEGFADSSVHVMLGGGL